MLRFVSTLGNAVSIDIEDRFVDMQALDACFLFSLAQRDCGKVVLAIGMSARLQPASELAMVHEQCTLAIRAYQPGRTGEVARQMLPLEDGWRGLQELGKPGNRTLFR